MGHFVPKMGILTPKIGLVFELKPQLRHYTATPIVTDMVFVGKIDFRLWYFPK
jgi:hypothetical protein